MLLVGIVSKGKDGARRLWKSFEWLEKKCAWRSTLVRPPGWEARR